MTSPFSCSRPYPTSVSDLTVRAPVRSRGLDGTLTGNPSQPPTSTQTQTGDVDRIGERRWFPSHPPIQTELFSVTLMTFTNDSPTSFTTGLDRNVSLGDLEVPDKRSPQRLVTSRNPRTVEMTRSKTPNTEDPPPVYPCPTVHTSPSRRTPPSSLTESCVGTDIHHQDRST